MLVQQLAAQGVPELDVVMRLGHSEPIKRAIIDDHWVALMPAYAVADDVAAGRLRIVAVRRAQFRERRAQFRERIALVTCDAGYLSPLALAAVGAIRSRIADAPGLSRADESTDRSAAFSP